MGSRRSGKSSMSHVVFHKMPPHETFFMEGTGALDVKYVANNALVQFQVSDSHRTEPPNPLPACLSALLPACLPACLTSVCVFPD